MPNDLGGVDVLRSDSQRLSPGSTRVALVHVLEPDYRAGQVYVPEPDEGCSPQ